MSEHSKLIGDTTCTASGTSIAKQGQIIATRFSSNAVYAHFSSQVWTHSYICSVMGCLREVMQVGSPTAVCAAGQCTDTGRGYGGSSGLGTTLMSENKNKSILGELSL